MEGLEGEILEFPPDGLDPQTVRQRGVDPQSLLGLLDLLLPTQVAQRAHVVQTVGQFDEDDPDILGHRYDHLAEVLRLFLLHTAERHLTQLGDAVHQQGGLVAKLLAYAVDGDVRVLHHVMQQCGGDGERIKPELGADGRHAQGMMDVVLPTGPPLVAVLGHGHFERASHKDAIEIGVVPDDLPEQLIQQESILVGDLATGDDTALEGGGSYCGRLL